MKKSKFIWALSGLAEMTDLPQEDCPIELFEKFVLEPHGETTAQIALVNFVAAKGIVFPTPGQLLELIPRASQPRFDVIEGFLMDNGRAHAAA